MLPPLLPITAMFIYSRNVYWLVYCLNCGRFITRGRTKYCSSSCTFKAYRKRHPEYREREKIRKRKSNIYVKKDGDKRPLNGPFNPNWKGGVSKDNMRYRSRYVVKNPKKIRVQGRARSLIRRGKIKRGPCVVCGAKNAHGHHMDYSKPLELTWLCQKHHNQYHSGKIRL